MTTHPAPPDAGPAAYLRRRTGLIVPLLLLVTGVVLGVGTLTMDVPANVASPGPQLFPTIVAVACVVFAVLLGVDVLRRPEPAQVAALTSATTEAPPTQAHDIADGAEEAEDAEATRPRSNRWAVTGVVGTVVAFIVLLVPLGWLLSGALLFWGVSRALGSRRPVFDVFLSIAISSTVQLAFSAGLGLSLPPGILAGVF
ncbi:tripartite tricarboxylate transporter TctB family protein [Streptomyces sp. CRN 30]|uniref:tripartite tricarboxylate transporter TctB family protein n=1 Tax=Streptomyces sp. CRN 30 TaxID=3075613 RepID=UPI002A7F2D9D|nr:tripartite tricarboxylate transporter TctB family protein [Streptomyces sp. CRN 30]